MSEVKKHLHKYHMIEAEGGISSFSGKSKGKISQEGHTEDKKTIEIKVKIDRRGLEVNTDQQPEDLEHIKIFPQR